MTERELAIEAVTGLQNRGGSDRRYGQGYWSHGWLGPAPFGSWLRLRLGAGCQICPWQSQCQQGQLQPHAASLTSPRSYFKAFASFSNNLPLN